MEDNNHDKVISSLELDRDVGFLRGHQENQGHQPHDDDNEEEVDTLVDNNIDKMLNLKHSTLIILVFHKP